MNAQGCEGERTEVEARVIEEMTLEVTSENICFEGYGQMEITSDEGVEFRWYKSMDATEPIFISETKKYTTDFLTENTSFYVSSVNAQGCEGERTEVEARVIEEEIPVIFLEEDIITSSIPNGNQWFYNGEMMVGDTLQSIQVLHEGEYHVANTQSRCVSESEPVTFLITALASEIDQQLNLYPNPVKNVLHVTIETTLIEQVVSVEIVDLQGRIKYRGNRGMETDFQIDVKMLEKGIYILRINFPDKTHNRQFFRK